MGIVIIQAKSTYLYTIEKGLTKKISFQLGPMEVQTTNSFFLVGETQSHLFFTTGGLFAKEHSESISFLKIDYGVP